MFAATRTIEFLRDWSFPAKSSQDLASIGIQWLQPIQCQYWQEYAQLEQALHTSEFIIQFKQIKYRNFGQIKTLIPSTQKNALPSKQD